MIQVRKAEDRGHAHHGWLDTYHTFSFNTYYDERFMGYRSLRVINDDRVQAGKGFPLHPHNDMEIITYVLEGALEHKDSMGNGSVIRPGDVQRMSAGTGVYHSEFNPSDSDPVHLLQVWILPNARGVKPSYEQKHYTEADRTGRWCLIASPDGRDDSVTIHQDAYVHAALLGSGDVLMIPEAPGRHYWLHVARGKVTYDELKLTSGDGAAISDEAGLKLTASEASELLLFDLA